MNDERRNESMNESMKKMEEILQDEKRLAEIMSGTPDEIFSKLKANGVELTPEEFDAMMSGLHAADSESDELTEADIESVAGGSKQGYDFWYKVGQAVDKALYRIFGHK